MYKLMDPNFLPRDWLINTTTPTHLVFAYFIYFLSFLGSLPLITIALHFSLYVAFAVAIYLINDLIYEQPFIPFLISISVIQLLIANYRVLSIGFLRSDFNPHAIACVLIILGITALLYEKYLTTGIFLGIAGLMHGNFLVLIPFLMLPLLLKNLDKFTLKDALKVIIPFILISLPTIFFIFKNFMFSDTGSTQSHTTTLLFGSGHHYLPYRWWGGNTVFLLFLGILLLGVNGYTIRKPEKRPVKIFNDIILIIACLVFISYFCTTTVLIIPIMQLLLPRLGAFALVLCLILYGGAMADIILKPNQTLKDNRKEVYLLVLTMLVIMLAKPYAFRKMFYMLIAYLVPAALNLFLNKKKVDEKSNWVKAATVAGILFIMSNNALAGFHRTVYENKPAGPYREIYTWARKHTKETDLFIVPYWLVDGLRLRARRSIVIDLYCPVDQRQVPEWFRRLMMICGIKKDDPKPDYYKDPMLIAGYRSMDNERVKKLVEEFKANYLIVERLEHTGNLDNLEKVFTGEMFLIYKL
ncbi:MAG: DUF6798 domain-containing protein [bacterium]